MIPEFFANLAQRIRHAPGLRSQRWLWDSVRRPYRRVMRAWTRRKGLRVLINGEDEFVLNGVFVRRLDYETAFYRSVMKRVRISGSVLDIGSYRGVYALGFAKRVGPHGKVVAVEPNPSDAEILKKNVRANGFGDRVVLERRLFGSVAGRKPFEAVEASGFFEGGVSTAVAGTAHQAGRTTRPMQLEVTTVDAVVRALGVRPHVLKIDVEGMEWDVLRGAERTIFEFKPIVAVELHPPLLRARGESAEELIAWMFAHGFDAANPAGGLWAAPLPEETFHVLFLPPGSM